MKKILKNDGKKRRNDIPKVVKQNEQKTWNQKKWQRHKKRTLKEQPKNKKTQKRVPSEEITKVPNREKETKEEKANFTALQNRTRTAKTQQEDQYNQIKIRRETSEVSKIVTIINGKVNYQSNEHHTRKKMKQNNRKKTWSKKLIRWRRLKIVVPDYKDTIRPIERTWWNR